MSAAASSARTQVRANAPARQPVSQAAQGFSFVADDDADEIRVHVADLPRIEESLTVDGLRPTLMSRLFDLFSPLK